MSKINKKRKVPKVTEENRAFLNERNLKILDVAAFYNMKPHNFTTSTAKNKYISALRNCLEFLDV